MRRTKIVATLGPASRSREVLSKLIQAGVDVIRLNFSHGTAEEHEEDFFRIRSVSEELGLPVAILQDLQGPKIRLGDIEGGRLTIQNGERVLLVASDDVARAGRLTTSYQDLPKVVAPGDPILLDDGLIELKVREVRGAEVECEVICGGTVKPRKGINIPNSATTLPALTEKDERDLEAGLKLGVDFVALSFVRSAADVSQVRERIAAHGLDTPVIAKIEKPQAVENLEAILENCDGLMVARGDLGVEMAPAKVPLIQKRALKLAVQFGRVGITATQMLESMTHQPRPTRAEASDVANAILDGTSAVMLSGETAVGDYPVEAVRQMVRIAEWTEPAIFADRTYQVAPGGEAVSSYPLAVIHAAVLAADELDARAIVVFTESGNTARLLSQWRPENAVFAFSYRPETVRRLAMVWGVRALQLVDRYERTRDLLRDAERILLEEKLVSEGDTVVMIAGYQMAEGAANMMKVHRVGEGIEKD
ncbi:MAG: pyruvate kinase [Planctomycetota bacterium]